MIKLRLQRKGRKKRPLYHIVVADSRSPRDGRIIERLGRFDNISERQELTYNEERIIHWLKIGAQPSDTVRSILKKEGILYKMHLARWGKSDEEIEAALEEWRNAKIDKESESEHSRKEKQKIALKAEEKEYKKQLEEKAAAAAKTLEKKKEQEAKAEEKVAEAETSEEVTTDADTDTETVDTDEPAAETEAQKAEELVAEEVTEEPVVDEEEEAKAEEKTTKAEEPKADAEEVVEEKAADEPKAEAEEVVEVKEEPVEEKKKEETPESGQVSTDMNATEAIDHIKNSSIDELEGFVPDSEERVTVRRAWESKQAE